MAALIATKHVDTPLVECSMPKTYRMLAVTRISLGWLLLWTFLDSTFALGFPTGRAGDGTTDYLGDAAWVNGGSPTAMLEMATKGPFAGFFRNIAGEPWLDWLFMSIFLVAGAALILGVGTRIAATAGAALFLVAWIAVSIWPPDNPFMSQYLIYAMVLVGLAFTDVGDTWSLSPRWNRTRLVGKFPIFKSSPLR